SPKVGLNLLVFLPEAWYEMEPINEEPQLTARSHLRGIARQLLPGILLPGLIYYAVSRQAPTLVALAAASSVPALDAVVRLLQRKAPSPIGLLFLVFTGTSVALATMLHSPMFILVKSAVISG